MTSTAHPGHDDASAIGGLLESRAVVDRGRGVVEATLLRPVANLDLLEDVLRIGEAVRAMNAAPPDDGRRPIGFVVFEGPSPKAFGLGGDLSHILAAIDAGDAAAIRRCADVASAVCHALFDGFGADVITASLVRGRALGGAFEAARSCDLLVAEEGSTFALPEVEFGLFPGAATTTAIAARVDDRTVRRLAVDGETLGAQEAFALGIVDVLAPQGGGRAAVDALVARLSGRHLAALSTYRGLAASRGLTKARFMAEAERWAEAIPRLGAADLAAMRRLAELQGAALRRRAAAG